ncbi:cytochrome c biogenesis CcdA family protein [Phytohabitans rumicis]|uniref:Cytochrome C biogenesis protein CcdA n=1 Tax=Phytohabitans rumicis TaxID=1076125 RepID=A0A6V8L3U1_9ACTN|nr:cytochrome c biogenesis protein CcdA [Phytohabitans rumicis]GFJ90210.1 cytochrome C biogenesis protein CcdA [Phytohabitans rumicis]
MGDTFRELANGGPIALAIGAAALAGLVSFLSPCVLPLVPGYLSYVTGLSGVELDAKRAALSPAGRVQGSPSQNSSPTGQPFGGAGRVLAGTALFISGFTVVFTLTAVLFTSVSSVLLDNRRALEIGGGILIIVLGLAFVGLVPGMQREFRIHKLPNAGLLGAPVFGAVFALSWVPCVGPTLGAVLTMATVSGKTDRAVVLAVAYCLGLGLPFIAFGLGFRRFLGVFKAIRRNSRWVTRAGGALLIVVGIALVTGGWNSFLIWLQTTVGVGKVGI